MKRRLIQITAEQEALLIALAATDGNSVAAHVRTAIDLYLRTRARPEASRTPYPPREAGTGS